MGRQTKLDFLKEEFDFITKIERSGRDYWIWYKRSGIKSWQFAELYEKLRQMGYEFGLGGSGQNLIAWKKKGRE
jgi:hypothetical protein